MVFDRRTDVAVARPVLEAQARRLPPLPAVLALFAAFALGFGARSLGELETPRLSALADPSVERASLAGAPTLPVVATTAERSQAEHRRDSAVRLTNVATAALTQASLLDVTDRRWIPETAPPATPAEVAATNVATHALTLGQLDDLGDEGRPIMRATQHVWIFEAE